MATPNKITQPDIPGKSNIFFSKNDAASDAALRRAFLLFAPNVASSKVIGLESLTGLSSFLPLEGTRMHEMLTQIIGAKTKANEMELFVAYVSNLCQRTSSGSFEKNGMRYTELQGKPYMFVCSVDVVNEVGDYEHVGKIGIQGPFLNAIRQAGLARTVQKMSEDYYRMPLLNLTEFLASGHRLISNVDGLGAGGALYENEAYKTLVMEKSHGNQNLVLNDPSDTTKIIKMVLGPNQGIKTNLEVLASKVIAGAGFRSPKSEIMTDEKTGVKFIHMDNYRVKNSVTEVRQEYFLDMMRKDRSEAHNMNYQEMALYLDRYDESLPNNLRDPFRLERNKQEVFKWALVNAVTNNTDNHGRNLAVMIDDKGRLEVTPFFDVGFDSESKPMSTFIDGIPPIHHIDILNDGMLQQLWDEMGMKSDFGSAIEMRNDLVESMNKIPEYARQIGMDLFSGMDHVIQSVSVQSAGIASIVTTAVEEARNRQLDNQSTINRGQSSGVECN